MISDIVAHGLPAELRGDMRAWAGCIGGALEEEDYLAKIRAAGFQDVRVVGKYTYDEGSLRAMGGGCCTSAASCEPDTKAAAASKLAGRISSIHVSAVKPA